MFFCRINWIISLSIETLGPLLSLLVLWLRDIKPCGCECLYVSKFESEYYKHIQRLRSNLVLNMNVCKCMFLKSKLLFTHTIKEITQQLVWSLRIWIENWNLYSTRYDQSVWTFDLLSNGSNATSITVNNHHDSSLFFYSYINILHKHWRLLSITRDRLAPYNNRYLKLDRMLIMCTVCTHSSLQAFKTHRFLNTPK